MKKREIIKLKNKKAQVWVETVLYTLIGLTIIGILLAVSKPHLERQQDKALIEQSINGMNVIDERIYTVLSAGQGNKRRIDLRIGRGYLTIDSKENKIIWEIESRYKYSEEGIKISAGKIDITTLPHNPYKVVLEIEYPFDLRFNNQSDSKSFGQSSIPYVLTVENLGIHEGKTLINFNEI